MKKKTIVVLTRLGMAVAICVAASAASAQSLVKGSFTLPYEVHWGKAVLAPGHYTIAIDRADRPAAVSTPTGRIVAYVTARSFDDARKDAPTALVITKTESQRVVRSFNWREGNRRFIYRPFTAAERQQVARAAEVETVAIRVAQR
jgi:hypothetical protein